MGKINRAAKGIHGDAPLTSKQDAAMSCPIFGYFSSGANPSQYDFPNPTIKTQATNKNVNPSTPEILESFDSYKLQVSSNGISGDWING